MAERAAGAVRWADGGPFAIIPLWVLRAGVSDRAVRLYATLAQLANSETLATTMRRKELAGLLACSPSTLDVAIKELRDIGAVGVEAQYADQGDRSANRFLVRVSDPRSGSTGGSADGSTDGSRGNKKTSKEQDGDTPGGVSLARTEDEPPAIVKVGGQNEPLNVLMEECGVDPGNRQRVKWAVAALNGTAAEQGIRHLFWLEACRYAADIGRLDRLDELRAEPAEFSEVLVVAIRRKAGKYRREMKGARLTPTALRNWWLDLEKQGGNRGMSREEMLNYTP